MTQAKESDALKVARHELSEYEQMQDAQKGCVPCKLCGGAAIISDAGIGAGYYVRCSNSGAYRAYNGCMVNDVRLGGWAYNVMDWWNRLHADATRPTQPASGAEPSDEAYIVSQRASDAYGAATGGDEDGLLAAAWVIQKYGDRRAAAAAPINKRQTVDIIRDWLMSGDYPVSQWEKDFAAALDAAPQPQQWAEASPVKQSLTETAKAVIDNRFSTYKARNGREVGIQGDDGEKVWLVHSDDMNALEHALSGHAGNSTETDIVIAKLDFKMMREALTGIADDWMSSKDHHQGWVLIPVEKFSKLRVADRIMKMRENEATPARTDDAGAVVKQSLTTEAVDVADIAFCIDEAKSVLHEVFERRGKLNDEPLSARVSSAVHKLAHAKAALYAAPPAPKVEGEG